MPDKKKESEGREARGRREAEKIVSVMARGRERSCRFGELAPFFLIRYGKLGPRGSSGGMFYNFTHQYINVQSSTVWNYTT